MSNETNFDAFSTEIAARQYFQPGEETIEQMFYRAAGIVADRDPALAYDVYDMMVNKRFSPGGRILAGAGTQHGNLLNCFVQDESPHDPGTNLGALHLAQKLALVTRVGGGNGLNLDAYRPKFELTDVDKEMIGDVTLVIDEDHPNADDVISGTFFDLSKGERVHKGYRTASVGYSDEYQQDSYDPDEVDFYKPLDDTADIWYIAARMVESMLFGRDVVVDLSDLRPENSPVRGSGGTSSGPASFAVEVYDNFATWAKLGGSDAAGPVATLRYLFAPTLRVIRQGGVRRGAGMATLSAWHPDILDFVTAKDLDREQAEGDISTFNMSVLVNDSFMQAAQDTTNPEYTTLLKIARHAWATGEPGLLYIDEINDHNPLFEIDGPIMATNPCGEIGLYPGEPCDLGALNVSQYVHNYDGTYQIDYDELRRDAYHATRYLDQILDVEKSPLPEIAEAIRDKRRVGLGMMGLGDALIKLRIPYNTAEAWNEAEKIAQTIAEGALDASTDRYHEYMPHNIPAGIMRAGLNRANIALTTVAPTGTTAMVMGTTSGIEPLFAPFIYRRVGAEYKQVLHPLFKEMMQQFLPSPLMCTWREVQSDNPAHENAHVPDEWDWGAVSRAISENHGSVQGLAGIPRDIQDVFVCAHDIEPDHHVDMQSAVQHGFNYPHGRKARASNSISKTINLPKDAEVKDVHDIFIKGWHAALKGITVYRDGSRENQVLSTSINEDDGSTAASQERDEQLGEIIAATCDLDGTCDI